MSDTRTNAWLDLLFSLEELAELGDRALESGRLGNDYETRTAVDEMRLARAILKYERISLTDGEGAPEGFAVSKQRLAVALRKISAADRFVSRWVHRYTEIIPFEKLLENEMGVHAHLDSAVPLVWNRESDILILIGQFPQIYYRCLRSRSQRRVLSVGEKIVEGSVGEEYFHASGVDEILPVVLRFGRPPPRKVKFLYSPDLENAAAKDRDLERKVEDAVNGLWMNFNTINLFGRRWLNQGVANLGRVARSKNWTVLRDAIKSRAAVIVSPGPSLDKNIDQLVGVSEKIYIISTAQALPILFKRGIYPDLVTVVDPQDMMHYFEGVDVTKVGGLLVGASCHPGIWDLPFPDVFTFDASPFSDRWISKIFDDETLDQSGGSVSVTSLHFALRCKFSYIGLVGQDLALTDGRQYAINAADGDIRLEKVGDNDFGVLSGMSEGMREMVYRQYLEDRKQELDSVSAQMTRLHRVPAYFGGEVYTTGAYLQFKEQFSQIAKTCAGNSIRLFNCTEGGAYISGFEHLSLRDFIDFAPTSRETLTPEKDLKDIRVNRLNVYLRSRIFDMNLLISLCDRALFVLDSVADGEVWLRNKSALQQVEGNILDAILRIPFLHLGIQSECDLAIRNIRRSKSLDEVLSSERYLISLIREEAGVLLPSMTQILGEAIT